MSALHSESRLIALIVAAAFFMQTLDASIMNTSLPQMAASLQVAPLDLSVGITLYMLTAAAFIPLSGWLADRFGARRIFIGSILVFTGASLICGLATNLLQFTTARAVQGLGGALMTPVGRLIVLRNTEKNQLLEATALITWPSLAAPIIGPALGGFLTTYVSWRWNFLLNVPLGVAGVWLAMRHVPKLASEHTQQLDWPGFILSALAMIALLYGLELLSHAQSDWRVHDWALPCTLILLGTGLSWLSVRHFQRTSKPLLGLSCFSIQTYRLATVTAGTALRTAINALPFLLPLLFQVGFGLNALAAGGYLLVYFIGNIGMKPATTALLRRFGFRTVLIGNGCVAGISIMLCALFTAETNHWLMMAVVLLAGTTRSMQFTSLSTLSFSDTTPEQRSSATTWFSVFNQVGSLLAVALSTLVLNFALLNKPQWAAGLNEIRVGFVVMGAIAILASLGFLKLPVNAGAEVSGHRV